MLTLMNEEVCPNLSLVVYNHPSAILISRYQYRHNPSKTHIGQPLVNIHKLFFSLHTVLFMRTKAEFSSLTLIHVAFITTALSIPVLWMQHACDWGLRWLVVLLLK